MPKVQEENDVEEDRETNKIRLSGTPIEHTKETQHT